MQESKEPIERPDPFSCYLRERLEDHHMPVDTGGWVGVEAALSRRRRIRRRWLAVAGAVAAVLTGLVLLLPFHKERPDVPRMAGQPAAVAPLTPQPDPAVAPLVAQPDPVVAPLAAQPEEASPAGQPRATSPAVAQSLSSRLLATAVLPEEKAAEAAGTVPVTALSTDETPQETPTEEEQTPTAPTEQRRIADVPADRNGYRTPASSYRPSPARNAKRSAWLLAAGFGTGSSVDMSIGLGERAVYDNAEDPNSLSPEGQGDSFNTDPGKEVPWTIDNGAHPEQFADVTYHLPLSFGMTVRKSLTSRLALESGLVYTYLRTSYSGGNRMTREAEYRYHYLGIPLNLVAYLVDRPQWNLYLSAGIMGEKGVRGTWEGTYASLTGPTSHQSGSFSISGLQWSINTSVGISYRLQRQWSLYAEPRFSYFFDNNQPATARTDHPVSLGIGGGIRFEF